MYTIPIKYVPTSGTQKIIPGGRIQCSKRKEKKRLPQKRTCFSHFSCSWIYSPLKRYLSVRSHDGLPRKCWSSSPQHESERSPWSIQSCVPPLQVPSCSKSPSWRFRSNWVRYDYNQSPIGSKKENRSHGRLKSYLTQWDGESADGDLRQLGPWKSGKQLWIDLGESSDSIWGKEDQYPTIPGQKLMRRNEKHFLNWLQIHLNTNWPYIGHNNKKMPNRWSNRHLEPTTCDFFL